MSIKNIITYNQDEEPDNPSVGDVWYKLSGGSTQYWYNNQWIDLVCTQAPLCDEGIALASPITINPIPNIGTTTTVLITNCNYIAFQFYLQSDGGDSLYNIETVGDTEKISFYPGTILGSDDNPLTWCTSETITNDDTVTIVVRDTLNTGSVTVNVSITV